MVLWGLFMGAAAAVLAPVGPGAFVPLKMAIASAGSVGNQVYVAVVIDFGGGSAPPTIVKCVPVAPNNHDADALAAAVGSGNVAYSNSGLLCAIDDYPANGVQNCGQSVGSGVYDYWSYWHGSTGSWVYANNGPAEQSVSSPPGDVLGLRFQTNEPASSSDPPPSITASFATICPGVSITGTAPAPPPAPSTTTTLSTTPTTAQTSPGLAPVTTTTRAVGSGPRTGASTTTSAPKGTTTTTVAGADGGSSGPGGTNGTGPGRGSSGTHRIAVARVASSNSGGGSSGDLLPVVLVAVVVAVLGGLAFFRWRRRPAEE